MAGAHSPPSPLARRVLFIVCLAIAGSFVAGVHYVAVDLPLQKEQAALHASLNDNGVGTEDCVP